MKERSNFMIGWIVLGTISCLITAMMYILCIASSQADKKSIISKQNNIENKEE